MKVQKVNLLMPVRKYLPASLVYIKVNSMNQYTAQFCSSNFSCTSWFYFKCPQFISPKLLELIYS